jgi:thiol-disulfide isomerase/thioredoxin
MRNILFSTCIFLFSLWAFSLAKPAFAQNDATIYFFWGSGCPHCAEEKPFLEQLENTYPSLKVHSYEVWYDESNRALLTKVGKKLNKEISGVPFTIIGEKTFTGYLNDTTTGKEIENALKYCLENRCTDQVAALSESTRDDVKPTEIDSPSAYKEKPDNSIPEHIALPLFGNIRTKDFSLPVLTIMLAALDGFNPCAMWTLLFLISLLIGMKDKKRMWILGSTFIISSAAVYFLFMAAWLHLILFIGFIIWIRIAIGVLGFGAGIYNLREYFMNKENACKVTRGAERRRVFETLKRFTQEKHFWLALGGIILLAAAVNIVELICSAGLPVIYTQILTLSDLATWQYYLYLLLYILIFMLDDLFVFIVSMKTLELTGVTTKFSRTSHLIGGLLMLIIGYLLIFKPEWLMFG